MPASARISARLQRVQEHSLRVNILRTTAPSMRRLSSMPYNPDRYPTFADETRGAEGVHPCRNHSQNGTPVIMAPRAEPSTIQYLILWPDKTPAVFRPITAVASSWRSHYETTAVQERGGTRARGYMSEWVQKREGTGARGFRKGREGGREYSDF